MAERAVQRKLTQIEPLGAPQIDLFRRRQDGDRNWQVVARAFLLRVRRGKVDGDSLDRERRAAVADRGTDALFCLLDGGIRQTNDVKGGHPVGDVYFNFDTLGLDADDRT